MLKATAGGQEDPGSEPGNNPGDPTSGMLLLTGEITIDGRSLGQIVARRQAHELTAAPASSNAVNLRTTPLNPGVAVPLP